MFGFKLNSALVSRMGVAFAFLYPPVDAFFHPDNWIGFFPQMMRGYFPDSVMLNGWGVVEITIALWILSGKRVFIPATLATIFLVLIVSFNFSLIDILFRDIAIAFGPASLALASYREEKE